MIMSIQIIMLMFLSLINLMINILPSQNKIIHPIIMGLILLILLISSSMSLELYYYMNWLSYLMYLIIIGGLMIIFLYFTSFISNMKMSMKWNYIIMIPIKFMLILLFMLLMINLLKLNYPWYYNSLEINLIFKLYINKFTTMYMYMYNKSYSLMLCMIYLLMILIFIVKICINKKLSLRKLN